MSPEDFADEFGPEFAPQTSAYGRPVQPVKPGITKRGKVALIVGATVVASGSLLTWQHYSAQAEENGLKAQEMSLKQQELRIQELKEMNKATTVNKKEKATQDAERKKLVDACVDADKGLVGKQMGVTYSSVVADCKANYRDDETGAAGSDMAAASSASDTGSGGGGINSTGLLAIVAGGGVLVVFTATRAKKSHAA